MKAEVADFYTDIYLDEFEVAEHCLIGKGADTCIWLLVSAKGFECCYYHKPHALLDRFRAGLTVAKRDGCQRVKDFDPSGIDGSVVF